jgi:Formyltetrahydrofolate synthetase
VLATKTCLKLADYVITEAGFGADLGAEKFLDIKCRKANLKPNAVVIVATIRALKQHGFVAYEDLQKENVDAMLEGCANLSKHIETIEAFGLPYVVAINEFASDTKAEIEALQTWCKTHNHPMALSQVWAKGGAGAVDLAEILVDLVQQDNTYKPIYEVEDTIENKILTIAQTCYGAKDVVYSEEAKEQIALFTKHGWDKLPICMAKVPTSLSDDASICGAPKDFTITIRELRPSLGAGFIVALTGNVMTMPGLPKIPAANKMDIDEEGVIVGLF